MTKAVMMARLRAHKTALGFCGTCLKVKATEGFKTCPECRLLARLRWHDKKGTR